MKRRSKPRGWKEVAARNPRIDLTKSEALDLAKAWWGEHGDAFEPNPAYAIDSFGVGHWDHAIPVGDDELDVDKWPDLHLEGIGPSFAAAFRDADPRRWAAYCIRRRCIRGGRP